MAGAVTGDPGIAGSRFENNNGVNWLFVVCEVSVPVFPFKDLKG